MDGISFHTLSDIVTSEPLPRLNTAAVKDKLLDDYFSPQPPERVVYAPIASSVASVAASAIHSGNESYRSADDGSRAGTHSHDGTSTIPGRRGRGHPPRPGDDLAAGQTKLGKMHFADDVKRRAVYRGAHTSKAIVGAATGIDDELSEAGYSISSDAEIAARTAEKQLSIIQQSPAMEKILAKVLETHNSVVEVLGELVYRKDMSAKVNAANKAYVKLFERMLAEVLQIQRQKFNSQVRRFGPTKQRGLTVRVLAVYSLTPRCPSRRIAPRRSSPASNWRPRSPS